MTRACRETRAPRRGFRRGVGGARNDPGLSVKADWDSSALQGARYATWASHDEPWTRTTSTNNVDASQIMDVLRQSKRGVVVVGRLAPHDVEDVAAFLDEDVACGILSYLPLDNLLSVALASKMRVYLMEPFF